MSRIEFNSGLNVAQQPYYTTPGNMDFKMKQISLEHEPEIKYKNTIHYVVVSSNNRNSTNYPLHYNYRIDLNDIYRNVKCIELISVILPNQGSILDEPHIILDCDELNYMDIPNNSSGKSFKGFAMIPIKAPTQNTNGYINPELGCVYNSSKVFKTPLSSLSHFNIKIRNMDGDYFTFGQANGSTNKLYQNTLVFKISCQDKDNSPINHRNVF